MIRPVMLAAILLGFLTAFVVGELGFLVADSGFDVSRASNQEAQGAEPVVEDFYHGINDWIATGDPSLERLLAPGFVDHTSSSAPDRNAAELFAHLSAVRTAVPSLRFEILAIEANGATVSVDLMWSPGTLPALDGWTIALPVQKSFREILRIEEARLPSGGAPTISGRVARFLSNARFALASRRIGNRPFSGSHWMRRGRSISSQRELSCFGSSPASLGST
jgi:hypothetical protein